MTTLSTRDRRRKPTRKPFAVGLNVGTVLLRSWASHGYAFDLIEDELWADRDELDTTARFPFRLYWTGPDGQTGSKGFDSLKDAECYADHLSTPLPGATRHTPTDERWWAQNAPQSFQGTLPALAGGAPEPEPYCGLAGAWYMPEERELSDDASGAFLGEEA